MSWLGLFLLLFMGGVIFFQTIQGFFSALIMAVGCILCGTLALGLHEYVAQELLLEPLGDYSYAAALGGLFGISLLLFRLAMDALIPRNTMLPLFIDRGGSLACGIIVGLITIGMAGMSILMIPWGPTVLGYEGVDENGQTKDPLCLFLSPDKFTVKLCGYLTDTTLAGHEQSWFKTNPDFVTQLNLMRNTAASGSRMNVPLGSITISSVYTTNRLYKLDSSASFGQQSAYSAIDGPPAGNKWIVIEATLDSSAKDTDGYHRVAATQVRLVGESKTTDETQQYTLKGLGPFEGRMITMKPAWSYGSSEASQMQFVFEVPEDFNMRFMEYKRGGRAELTSTMVKAGPSTTTAPPPTQVATNTPPPPTDNGTPSTTGEGPKTAAVRPSDRGSFFGNQLGITLKRYTGSADAVSGTSLAAGHIVAKIDKQEAPANSNQPDAKDLDPEGQPLDSLVVPDNMRLLQLNVKALHANTVLGNAVNLARRVLKQWRVYDSHGNVYWPAGLVVECDHGGNRYMEVQYFPEDAWLRSQIRDYQVVDDEDLKGDYRLVFLFLVPPGAEITEFDAGNMRTKLPEKLVAPN
ncbi:MAG: hypothetical protein HJJLKODD_02337 [Phycisphaerae bacterium]|nr:hypothetical protein [Phycisphaerae bacterium]